MAYFITDKCDKNGMCEAICPAEAISEGVKKYVIDPELCIECGACAAACPRSAIASPS